MAANNRVKTEKKTYIYKLVKLKDTTILGNCRAFPAFRILTSSTRAIMLLSMKGILEEVKRLLQALMLDARCHPRSLLRYPCHFGRSETHPI